MAVDRSERLEEHAPVRTPEEEGVRVFVREAVSDIVSARVGGTVKDSVSVTYPKSYVFRIGEFLLAGPS